ncbi:MAG TPA: hypothetical protein VNJ07_00500 [Chitinophagales bacterium]|nr:hypothetical protein [Chitinophagales bacterium]
MRANILHYGRLNGIGKSKFYRINAVALLIAALISFSLSAKAKVFNANLDGKYNDPAIWVPSYPGNIIQETDTVYINNDVKLSSDIVVKGTVLVRRTGSLMGNRNVIVLQQGKLLNFGISIVDGLNNKGLVYNKHILEVALDLINSGEIVNQESIVIGNIADNIGLITGQGGTLIANKKLVNSQTGMLKGSMDVCSNNFMNVDGGTIDSTHLSFCGHRIFNNVYLSADIRRDNIVLRLHNSENKDYRKFQVERSIDGINYEPIATVNKEQLDDISIPFKYVDEEVVKSNSVFYRLRVTNSENTETFIPAIEVGSILSTNLGD